VSELSVSMALQKLWPALLLLSALRRRHLLASGYLRRLLRRLRPTRLHLTASVRLQALRRLQQAL
jgi:hypothetical protein